MLELNLPRYLPSAEELPDFDETPVDNELRAQTLAQQLRSLGIDPDTLH